MMDSFLQKLRETFGENRVKDTEALSKHSSLKVGGNATYYVELDKTEELRTAVMLAFENKVPFLVIGSGSKTLFSDDGFLGLVIKNNTRKFDILSRKGKIRNNKIDVDRAYVYADSGAILNQVVRFAIEQNLSGLEDALGIVGTAGGSLYDQKTIEILSPVLYQIQAMSFDGKIQQVIDHDLCYTDSKGAQKRGKYVVLSLIFELFPGQSALLWEKGKAAIEKRAKHKPENPLSYPAFFDITTAEAMSIPTPGYSKDVSYLLRKAGLSGYSIGGAMLAKEDPNYLINLGNASGNDMIAVLQHAEDVVRKQFGVKLASQFVIHK